MRASEQEPTVLTIPVIAVKMSCLYRCIQKSASSSKAKFLKIPHPALLVSKFESVSVCSNRILTICSRSNSLRHFESSIMFVIALAAADLVFNSGLWRSFRTGRIRCSRIAASSGSEGGFAVGFARFLVRFLGLDLPMVIKGGDCLKCSCSCVVLTSTFKKLWVNFLFSALFYL